MRTMEEISELMAERRLSLSPAIERMMVVRDRYNADVVVPVPNTDDDIPYESLAPLLIADAVDHPALYASQVAPNIFVPALDPAKPTGTRSVDFANRRRKALYHSWDKSWWEMVMGRFYRQLTAYATAALVVEYEHDVPRVTTRDPLSAYPEPRAPEDLTLPNNVGFIKGVSLEWLHANYPATRQRFPQARSGFAVSDAAGEGDLWDIVEWIDEDCIVTGVLGPRAVHRSWTQEPIRYSFELSRYPNPVGRCTAVIGRRVTLDRVISQLSNLTGHVDLMATLMYLDIRATERSVFPDRYVLAKTGQNPRLVDGVWHDGASGEMNMVLDADAIGNLPATPDPNGKIVQDRLERNFRVSSGLIPQSGGETYGALRTGRGIDALMGAALDPRTAELHHIAERYFTAVNEIVLAAYKAVSPAKSFSVYSPLDPGAVEFVPSTHVENGRNGTPFVDNSVTYPIPGMDDINSTQVIGQMMGAGLISTFDARRMHPHIKDPEGTERRMLAEQMQALMLSSLGERAQGGGIPPSDLAAIARRVLQGEELHDAIDTVQREAQERQAAEPSVPAEAAPGLANPGEGAEMGAGGLVSGGGTRLEQLREMIGALRATTPQGAP